MRGPDGHARRAYGLTGDPVVLVRPDGYVALTAGTIETAQLRTHLGQFALYCPTGHSAAHTEVDNDN
ncbi:hypothetical protein ACWCXH_25020 [Kitasatospora sp. NPDC001660]